MAASRELQVRTIDGTSFAVRVLLEDSVKSVKEQLQQQLNGSKDFDSTMQFHLFLKGGKVDPATQLSSLSLLENDFFVIIPYSKKKKGKRRKIEEGPELTEDPNLSTTSPGIGDGKTGAVGPNHKDGSGSGAQPDHAVKPAEAIWNDIFADLAAMKDFAASDGQRTQEGHYSFEDSDVTNNVLHSSRAGLDSPLESKELYGKLTRQQQGGESGDVTHEEQGLPFDQSDNVRLPLVLQRLMSVFRALNAVCGFLNKQHMQATWKTVREAMHQLCPEQVTEKDIRALAALCPKLIVLSNMTTDGEVTSFYIDLLDPSAVKKQEQAGNATVTTSTNTEQIGPSDAMPSTVGKRWSDRMIKNIVERRDKAFQKAVKRLVKHLQTSELAFRDGGPSLEEFINGAADLTKQDDEERDQKDSLPKPPKAHKGAPRCTSVESLGALEMIDHLNKGLGSRGQSLHCEHIKHRDAAYGELSHTLRNDTKAALDVLGIKKLYTHQARAINAAMSGRNVIIATSTASGKSICYNIPVLNELFQNSESCAIYLFPTKALAQDQLRALRDMTTHTEVEKCIGVYDGDTPEHKRLVLRDTARLFISNPDMLHVSIMPYHRQFTRILSNLRYVVVDEAHAYRGVFGCHTALILRRLRRLCHYLYGTEPTFIVCSATVANPEAHAQELLGVRKIEVVQGDGSPCGDKLFILWNPPMRQFQMPVRKDRKLLQAATTLVQRPASPIVEVAMLLAEMVQHNLRCIAFCKSRKLCELVYNYTREILRETAPDLVSTIRSYRGGYSPVERRYIESDLFGGKLRGVAATNALELGVDVGSLDATLHLGFPGTVSSLWQQSGRAGRREKPSLSIYVAFGGPLDQHFMRHPGKFFAKPIENATIDAQNEKVVGQHLSCAAVEYPLNILHDNEYFGSGLRTAISDLSKEGRLGRQPANDSQNETWNYIGQEKSPSQSVSIRVIDTESYKIINMATNNIIESVEESMAFYQIYEGAVYMNQGRTYLVKTLDLAGKVALCQEADLKYYTKARDVKTVHVTGSELDVHFFEECLTLKLCVLPHLEHFDRAYPRNINISKYRSTTAMASSCTVTTRWLGYRRIWHGTVRQFDNVELFLPDVTFDSQAVWIRVPAKLRVDLTEKGIPLRAGLHAANHALVNVMPLYIMCNPSDLGTECANPHDSRYFPERVLVFDRHPGGIGIAAQARPMFYELLTTALELLTACECTTENGCPGCVQTLDCSEYNEVIHKEAARIIIQEIIHAEDMYRETREKASQSKTSTAGFLNRGIP